MRLFVLLRMEHNEQTVRDADTHPRPIDRPIDRAIERTIARREFDVERKHVSVFLKENTRGHFVRVTEESHNGRINSIAIPMSGLKGFMIAVSEVVSSMPAEACEEA